MTFWLEGARQIKPHLHDGRKIFLEKITISGGGKPRNGMWQSSVKAFIWFKKAWSTLAVSLDGGAVWYLSLRLEVSYKQEKREEEYFCVGGNKSPDPDTT